MRYGVNLFPIGARYFRTNVNVFPHALHPYMNRGLQASAATPIVVTPSNNCVPDVAFGLSSLELHSIRSTTHDRC
jgi:hypothetical protein